MPPKKKRTYWCIADEELNMVDSNGWGSTTIYHTEIDAICALKILEDKSSAKFKVLRVTLTASPAGWK